MKYGVLNRWTKKVQFTAEIECKETDCDSIKLGLAVNWALKNNADLQGANLQGANLRNADLRGANFWGADLQGANFWGANLQGANFWGADLQGVKNFCPLIPISFVGENLRRGHAQWVPVKKDVYVFLGCFLGTEKEAIEEISKKYGAISSYAQMVRAACRLAREYKVINPTEVT